MYTQGMGIICAPPIAKVMHNSNNIAPHSLIKYMQLAEDLANCI